MFPSFTFNNNNNCYLKESAKLSNMTGSTAGWCPKGITNRNNIWGHTDNYIDFFLGRSRYGDQVVPADPVDMMCTNKGSLCHFPYMLRGEVNHFPSFHTRRIEYKEMEPLSLAKKIVPRRNGVAWMTIKASPCALGRLSEERLCLSLTISQTFALVSTKLWETSSN